MYYIVCHCPFCLFPELVFNLSRSFLFSTSTYCFSHVRNTFRMFFTSAVIITIGLCTDSLSVFKVSFHFLTIYCL